MICQEGGTILHQKMLILGYTLLLDCILVIIFTIPSWLVNVFCRFVVKEWTMLSLPKTSTLSSGWVPIVSEPVITHTLMKSWTWQTNKELLSLMKAQEWELESKWWISNFHWFSFKCESDWSRGWREFFRPILVQGKATLTCRLRYHKTSMTRSRLVLVLRLIAGQDGACFRPTNERKQYIAILDYFWTEIGVISRSRFFSFLSQSFF